MLDFLPEELTADVEYEDSIFKEMSEDIARSFERQISAVESIALNASHQSEEARTKTLLMRDALDTYKSELERAKHDAQIARVISVIAVIASIAAVIVSILNLLGQYAH